MVLYDLCYSPHFSPTSQWLVLQEVSPGPYFSSELVRITSAVAPKPMGLALPSLGSLLEGWPAHVSISLHTSTTHSFRRDKTKEMQGSSPPRVYVKKDSSTEWSTVPFPI